MNESRGDPKKKSTAQGSPSANPSIFRAPPPQGTYMPAGKAACEEVLGAVVRAILSFLHVEIVDASSTGNNRQMVVVRLLTRKAQNSPDKMKAELRTLWRLDVARAANAMIKFVDLPSGFEFRFALLGERGEFVTGLVTVEFVDVQRVKAA